LLLKQIRKLDAMFCLANYAVKSCKRTSGCSGSQHTPCIQKRIIDYFSRTEGPSDDDYCTPLRKSRYVCSLPTELTRAFVSYAVPS
jgi:ATP-dependent DNA helicase Q4